MGTNKEPPRELATDVNDNATINTGGSQDRTRLTGDTDKDPDITGKNLDPKHNTLTYGNRDASGKPESERADASVDQTVSNRQAGGPRGDATRGPSANVNDTPPKT
jgi:hypothetical protein